MCPLFGVCAEIPVHCLPVSLDCRVLVISHFEYNLWYQKIFRVSRVGRVISHRLQRPAISTTRDETTYSNISRGTSGRCWSSFTFSRSWTLQTSELYFCVFSHVCILFLVQSFSSRFPAIFYGTCHDNHIHGQREDN